MRKPRDKEGIAVSSIKNALAAAAIWVSTMSGASACIALPDQIPELEAVKTDLMDGEYTQALGFIAKTGATSNDITQFVAQLDAAYPGGFTRCETVYSKNVSPKFREELVLLAVPGKDVYYLYWQVVNFNDEWAVLTFQMTDEFAEIANRVE